MSAHDENEKYNLPCPYDPEVLCIQMPCSKYDDNLCDGGCPQKEKAANDLAKYFHETYEKLAPDFSYKTRKASAKPWAEVPEDNKNLMIAVAEEVYGYLGFYWLKAQLTTANKQILEYEQTEASVCPEDVGVVEYVKSLLSKLATANKENKRLLAIYEDWKSMEGELAGALLKLATANEEDERLRAYIRMVGRYAYAQHGDIKADAHSELYQITTLCRDESVEQVLKGE